jgi:hypothetical protein
MNLTAPVPDIDAQEWKENDMPAGSRTSFQKRQKELNRTEKQREKTAKRLARKLLPKQNPGSGPEMGEPEGFEPQPENPEVSGDADSTT